MNNDNKQIEKYIFGPFDGIFLSDKNLSNKNIAFNIKDKIFDKIFIQKEDFCMIGYGQSGSGKTSTLIYFDKTKEDGIITELCNLEEFTDNVSEINIDITNIYLTHGSNITDMNDFQDKFYTTNNINFNPRTTHTSRQPIFKSNLTTFIYREVQTSTQLQNMWHMKNSKLSIGEYILETFNKRIIEPTPNNPESSRSHVVITLTLQMKDENEKSRKLIICDLAGVENEFACESPEEIVKFSQKYATSIKYNSQDNLPQKNITLDRYACDQKQISENLNEINLYNDIQTKLNLIVSDHKFFTDMYNKFTGQTGGNCIESSNINNCSTEFKFKNIHNGNPNNENWLKFLNEINILVYPFIYGIKLKNIVVKYDKLKRGDNFTEINKEYKDMYNKIKNLTLYTKLEKPINIFNYDRLKKLKEENIKLYNYILSIHVKKSIELPDLTDEQRKYTIDNQVQWETNDKSLANLYKDILCEQQKLLIIPYNCILRRNEGYMINKSLYDLTKDIKTIILNSLQSTDDNKYLPIYWDKLIYPYCRNLNVDDEILLKFYSDIKLSPKQLSSKILKVMNNNLNDTNTDSFKNMNFGIFTVINTTNDDKTNNPPNPPYININRLIFYTNINFNSEELKKEILDILEKMKTYTFWSINNSNYNKYIKIIKNNDNLKNTSERTLKALGITLIEMISNVNPSTLIGSLESTTLLQNITYNDLICYEDKKREDILNKFENIGLSNNSHIISEVQVKNSTGGSINNYKQKYIKYKKKYINLLKQA